MANQLSRFSSSCNSFQSLSLTSPNHSSPHPSSHYILSPHPTSHRPIFFLWQFFQHDRPVVTCSSCISFEWSEVQVGGGGGESNWEIVSFLICSVGACVRAHDLVAHYKLISKWDHHFSFPFGSHRTFPCPFPQVHKPVIPLAQNMNKENTSTHIGQPQRLQRRSQTLVVHPKEKASSQVMRDRLIG